MPRPSREDPNCMGTLLYWLDERNGDGFADSNDINKLLNEKYEPTKTPKEGDVAVWLKYPSDIHAPNFLHTGMVVVGGTNPKIKSRLVQGGGIEELPADLVMDVLYQMKKDKLEGHILTDTDAMQVVRIVPGALPEYHTRKSAYK